LTATIRVTRDKALSKDRRRPYTGCLEVSGAGLDDRIGDADEQIELS